MPSPARRAAGFTLVEILVALGVAVLLVGALASALLGALRAERTADLLIEGGEVLQEQAALRAVILPEKDRPEPRPGWVIETRDVLEGQGTNRVAWTLIELHPQDQPSLMIQAAFRTE